MFSTPALARERLGRVLAGLALGWLAMLLVWIETGDAAIAHWLAAPPFNTAWRPVFRFLSEWGMVGFYLFFLGVLARGLVWRESHLRQIGLAYLYAQLFGSVLLVRLLKIGCGRPRPGHELPGDAFCAGPSLDSAFHAFPSGHTTDLIISALFVAIFVRARGAGVLALLLAIGVALSRVVLGSHHLSDVLAGALLGALMTWLVLRRYLLPHWRQRYAHFFKVDPGRWASP